ncbi:DUF2332 family protein [Mesorhizobium sp. CAU 1741]|uniref:DUF2332 domain-containing protein n=1 Tax=Mesorhizobium sp. CAU 1741 TaxID=3140366 RepID=UPI00325B8593
MALHGRIAEHFAQQADACARLGSPFTASLCRLLIDITDETTTIGRRIIHWTGDPRDDALALRICGGLHRLVIERADPELLAVYPPATTDEAGLAEAVAGAFSRHEADLHAALDSPPQTNEIARSAMLLPGFLTVAREAALPLALCEIGSSGGLNLLFDRFHYRYGEAEFGEAASPVHIAPENRSNVLPLDGELRIVSRHGCDIAPVDVLTQAGRARLRSYVWPDQPARLERLDGAIALAQKHPFKLERADAADFAKRQLAARPGNAAFVLFHSIMWQYLPHETRRSILASLAEAGANATPEASIAHLRMEPLELKEGWATLSLTSWPGGHTRHLAKCDFHGRWIEWTDG